MTDGVVIYWLRDLGEVLVTGSFYREEVQDTHVNGDTLYKVEKIIKKRKGVGGKHEYFVKWMNWPDRFNSWVPEEDIGDI